MVKAAISLLGKVVPAAVLLLGGHGSGEPTTPAPHVAAVFATHECVQPDSWVYHA